MHIPDGILPAGVIASGYGITAVATWYSLRRIQRQDDPTAEIPKASMFTAAFLVLSWVHVPVPPTSVHLILNGLMGVVLGWYAFPAILIGLFFQAVLFGHGGLTSLGVNAAMMGIPALLAYSIFRMRTLRCLPSRRRPLWTGVFGFLGGFIGLVAAAAILFVLLVTTVPATIDVATERAAISALVLAHVPLGVIEGAATALVVLFLLRVRPGLLGGDPAPRPARRRS
ncbi:cobalt transporter CbiM [Allosalinactinospora lopnorensis]|uniref:cobalt transporter CbiM n=1 Tax=Allosalinactinospora lopnorensis TaxID=1352348 RepID=UPI000623F725|nr:cobalt transporter CbiM [Allosalinactinospora lopnorensis]